MEWERSRHARLDVAAWTATGREKASRTPGSTRAPGSRRWSRPRTARSATTRKHKEFTRSHHAKAGEILASLDNVLAEKVAGMPGNIADAVNGCWQCHGAIVKFKRDAQGADPPRRPGGQAGDRSRHLAEQRHRPAQPRRLEGLVPRLPLAASFEAKLSRSPENCGKCHMGPDHPQIEIYNESKHGIAFYANRDRMALDKDGDWVLGKDYSRRAHLRDLPHRRAT